MSSSQKLGFCILIIVSVLYVYFSFFNKEFRFPDFKGSGIDNQEYNPLDNQQEEPEIKKENGTKTVKIFILDKTGKLRSVNRECDTEKETSCFAYAIKELVSAPSKWEKSKGFASEIPAGTKVLSVRESSNSVMIDLSSDFETGGGAESTSMRVMQVIKTANSNTKIPTYLYVNGRQANVIGGEGIMVKQPLSERSLDE